MTEPPQRASQHHDDDQYADRAVQQEQQFARASLARRARDRPAERNDDDREPGNQPMQAARDRIIGGRAVSLSGLQGGEGGALAGGAGG